jgi:hypothetical protein
MYRPAGESTMAAPPIQVVLCLHRTLAEVLAEFDVDCCAVAFVPWGDGRTLVSRRALRALTFGTILVDTLHDSPSYCRRLEKYARRGWQIIIPGYEEERLSPELRAGSFALLTRYGRLLLSLGSRRLFGRPIRLNEETTVCPGLIQEGHEAGKLRD